MTKKTLTVAAVQMKARLGDVTANLENAAKLIDEAFRTGAELIILPEFFTSAVGFDPSMCEAALPLRGKAYNLLTLSARRYDVPVGGSYIAIKEDGQRYNTFVLAFPDGTTFTHDKDRPTMWENCYYLGGDDDGILETPLGLVGAALCWELIRTQTAKRLLSKIDLLLAGSCWWTLPDRSIPLPFKKDLTRTNLETMKETPSRMARLLGVPVVHAAHAGSFRCAVPWLPGLNYHSYFLGETQIVNGDGKILARMAREQGAGVITAQITIGRRDPLEDIPEGYWIPRLHPLLKLFWYYQNLHGRHYYRRVTASLSRPPENHCKT